MADTYDLAMQLFRVASEKQKIEKSQGKLKPEDEIEFTEASFNDFSNSLSREFANLSPEEQKEAKRLLEYKINDNVSEVITGNATQGFSLNLQSVRGVINSAIETIKVSQQQSTQATQSNASITQQNQNAFTYQDVLNTFHQTHDIDKLYNDFYKLSPENMLNLFENLSIEEIDSLIDKRNSEYERKSDSRYVIPNETSLPYGEDPGIKDAVSKEEAGRNMIMEEYKNGTRKFKHILDSSINGIQNILSSAPDFSNPKQDRRMRFVATLLMQSELPPEILDAIRSNGRVFQDFYMSIENFARESVFKDVPPDEINFDYISKRIFKIVQAYNGQKESVNSNFLSKYKQYERSGKYMSYSDTLVKELGLSEDQINVLNSNIEIKTTFSDIVTCLCTNFMDTMDYKVFSGENLNKYYQCFLQKLNPNQKALFSFNGFIQLIHSNMDNGKIANLLKEADLPVPDIRNILNTYDKNSYIEFLNKSSIRRQNITQRLQSTPALSNLTEKEIKNITSLMVRSYNNTVFINSNINKSNYLNNIMFESYIKENLPYITQDEAAIDTIMKIVHESNKTQMALKYENSPLMGINYYLDDIQKMLGFKETNKAAISRAIRLSVNSSFPEKLNFDESKFAQVLETYGVDYDINIVKNPESFSKIVDLIRTSHDRFMEEAVYSGSGLSRETIDFFNFEKTDDSLKDKPSLKEAPNKKFAKEYKLIKEQYGIYLDVPGSSLPSESFSLFMNFKDRNERKNFVKTLRDNKIFAIEYTNMIRQMQAIFNVKGKINFTQELFDSYKSTYFSANSKELANTLTLENMQGIFKLINNGDVPIVDSVSDYNKETRDILFQLYNDLPNGSQYHSDYLKKTKDFRKKIGFIDPTTLMKDDVQESEIVQTDNQSKSDSVINSQSFEPEQDIKNTQSPAVQKGGLVGFINRFRNNMRNRNKDEGIFTSIKNAFVNAKNNSFEDKIENVDFSKDNQSTEESTHTDTNLDELSKKLREGLNVENIGIQNTSSDRKIDNSEQKQAESDEQQI